MNQQAMGILAGMLICVAIVFVVFLFIYILFLLNLHRTLAAVRERNRELSPGLVWLTLIPLFNIVWILIMVPKISNSIRNEFEARGWRTEGEGFARTTGMLWAWGGVASVVLSVVQNVLQFADMAPIAMLVSIVSLPLSLGILVCWIMFWVQTYQYRTRLGLRDRSSIEEDYDDQIDGPRRDEYDDRPRRNRDDFDDRDDDRPRRKREDD
jgi:hypothetical protein